MKRCFIAINLPQEIKDYLSFIIEKLKKQNPSPTIKWVREEGLHITLHFLGYLEKDKIKKIINSLELGAKSLEPVELKLGEINAFPNLRRPRVVFIEAKEVSNKYKVTSIKSEKLIQFQRELGKELEKLGIEVDKREWQSHITLARIKFSISNFQFPKQEIKKLRFQVKSIDLMESVLEREGAKYFVIKKFLISANNLKIFEENFVRLLSTPSHLTF